MPIPFFRRRTYLPFVWEGIAKMLAPLLYRVRTSGLENLPRTGQLMEIKPGFEFMARQASAPVMAAAIDGLWGSIFSFAGNKYLWKSPRLMPTHVFIAFGKLTPPEKASPGWARLELLDLGE